jgi:hypothetical protein
MALITIPTRTSSNTNASADINDLMSNDTYLEGQLTDAPWPVDSVYITIANEDPAGVFGGTWSILQAGGTSFATVTVYVFKRTA